MVSYFSYFYMLLRNFLNPTVLWRFIWIILRRYVKFKISGTASPCPACPPPPCWAPSAPTAPRWARSARATTRGDTESIEKERLHYSICERNQKSEWLKCKENVSFFYVNVLRSSACKRCHEEENVLFYIIKRGMSAGKRLSVREEEVKINIISYVRQPYKARVHW